MYDIKIKTKDGTYEYEQIDLDDLDLIISEHPDYDELNAKLVNSQDKDSEVE